MGRWHLSGQTPAGTPLHQSSGIKVAPEWTRTCLRGLSHDIGSWNITPFETYHCPCQCSISQGNHTLWDSGLQSVVQDHPPPPMSLRPFWGTHQVGTMIIFCLFHVYPQVRHDVWPHNRLDAETGEPSCFLLNWKLKRFVKTRSNVPLTKYFGFGKYNCFLKRFVLPCTVLIVFNGLMSKHFRIFQPSFLKL